MFVLLSAPFVGIIKLRLHTPENFMCTWLGDHCALGQSVFSQSRIRLNLERTYAKTG
jgi:hypothetical protein